MSICLTITCFPIQEQNTHFVSCTTLAPDLPFGMKSSGLGLSVAFVPVGVCSWLGGHPRSSPSLSSQALAMDCQQNIMQSINVLTAIPMIKNVTISWQMQYIKISDLSLGWLVGRSGHCTVSGPSGDGVSGAPSSLCDSTACCSSLRGCSSIQLANTSIVWESRSPATSGKDHREVELSEFKMKKWITECCFC